MKKKFFITMSAIIALFFVVAVTQVFGWQSTCSTTLGTEWRECSTASNPVTANPGGAAYVRVTAPGSVTIDCDDRFAQVWAVNGTAPIASAECPDGWCDGHGVCQTQICCVRTTWTAVLNTQYYVYTDQAPYTGSTCGPTTGFIKNGTYTCNQSGPQGP